MYRLLIIDDEPIIASGLHEYFVRKELPDVEILVAYSAEEALCWLESMKIDVVLSDVCMPGMTGIELLGCIEKQWPRCKVVLLTGHDEFDYIHKAIRSGCVTDYILKTEGMDKIGAAVGTALQAVKDELSVYHQREWLQRELPKAIVQLQRQLLLDVLRRTEPSSFRGLQTEFEALKLPLRACESVMAVSFSIEDWGKYRSVYERNLILYAIGNIAEKLLGSAAAVKCVACDDRSLIGLVQTADRPHIPREKREAMTIGFAHGTLETIQQVCRELFDIPVSAAAGGRFHPFERLPQEARRLLLAVWNGRRGGAERLTILREQEEEKERAAEEPCGRLPAQFVLEKLKQSILEGSGEEWTVHFGKFAGLFPEEGPLDPFDRLLMQQALNKMSLLCLEELGLKDRAVSHANLAALLRFDTMTPWGEIVSFHQMLLKWIQEMRSDDMRVEESNLIGRIHYFVRNNLNADLSVSRIAREVSLNPSYLSRWYKQTCGKGLSDYIQEVRAERGKELLKTTTCKVHEISEMLGFADSHYFFRFFKKTVGCTPQEYRNQTEP